MAQLPTGTVTFLFTDIERSTQRAEELGDSAWADALATHNGLLREAFERHNGAAIRSEGDSLFFAFARAGDAVNGALAAQYALDAHDWGAVTPIRVRVGMHTGEALVRDGDYVGHDVHKAKRVEDAGHGGQILLSQTTADLVRDHVKLMDLGPHRLKDLGEPQRLYQVGDANFPRLRSLDTFATNLPLQRTVFIGREPELAEITGMLVDNRLVTLTGVGGAGKTRLAVHVAADLVDEYEDGVYFVDLAPVSDPGAIFATIASAMQLLIAAEPGAGPTGPTANLVVRHLAGREVLLILDNCEHLLDACADAADRILGSCPRARILATSREALDVDGEQSWRVPSLVVPEHASEAESSEAVGLFVARARAVRPDFALTSENTEFVAEICRRVDGIPLAIEFAASRVSHLAPREIADRLGDMFRLLTGGRQRVQRQQTLQATLDWSYELLPEPERAVLRRCAVFAGSFTLDAAEQIVSSDDVSTYEVLDLLAGLVAKSLVTVDTATSPTRYRLIETVRLYAADKLRAAGESEAYRARHRDHFQSMVESFTYEQAYVSAHVPEGAQRDLPNLRGALEWSATEGRLDLLIRMARRMMALWFRSGLPDEGFAWLTRARPEDVGVDETEAGFALADASQLAQALRDPRGVEFAERALAVLGDEPSIARVRALSWSAVGTSVVSVWTGDTALSERARREGNEAVELCDRLPLPSPFVRVGACINLGNVELVLTDAERARDAFALAAAAIRANQLPPVIGSCLGLAVAEHLMGHHDAAAAGADVALTAPNFEPVLPVGPLCAAYAGAGRRDDARTALRRAVEGRRNFALPGASEHIAMAAAFMAGNNAEFATCSRLLAFVRSRTVDVGQVIPSPLAYPLFVEYTRRARAALGSTARERLAEGRAMNDDDVIAVATAIADGATP